MELLRARVDWFHATQPFGVANTISGYKPFGIHLRQLRGFSMGSDGYPELLKMNLVPDRKPRQGEEIYLANSGRTNHNGQPVADVWGYADNCDALIEKYKRDMTIDEAKQFLADKPCKILEHTYSTTQYGAVITIETTVITWLTSDGRYGAASGEFVTKTTRYGVTGAGDKEDKTHRVSVSTLGSNKFHSQTVFNGVDALALKDVGKPQRVLKGKKQGILWNGGWEDYVVDANSVRDMTEAELEKVANNCFPTIDDGNWLRCLFAENLGHDAQVVKVLAHLGGGE